MRYTTYMIYQTLLMLVLGMMGTLALSQGVPESLLKMGTYVAKFESVKEENKFLTVYFAVARYKKFAILRELKVNTTRYLSLTTGKYKYEDNGLVLKVKDLKESRGARAGTVSYSSCMDPAETGLWAKLGNRVDIVKNHDGTILKGGALFAYLFGKKEIKIEAGPPETAYLITLETITDIDGDGLNLHPVCFKAGMKGVIE